MLVFYCSVLDCAMQNIASLRLLHQKNLKTMELVEWKMVFVWVTMGIALINKQAQVVMLINNMRVRGSNLILCLLTRNKIFASLGTQKL